jgi:hypothetical protein
MPTGKPVIEDIQWIIVCMGAAMSSEDIAMYTDVGERNVQDILAHFKQSGDDKVLKCQRPKLHQRLCDYDIEGCNLHLSM